MWYLYLVIIAYHSNVLGDSREPNSQSVTPYYSQSLCEDARMQIKRVFKELDYVQSVCVKGK